MLKRIRLLSLVAAFIGLLIILRSLPIESGAGRRGWQLTNHHLAGL